MEDFVPYKKMSKKKKRELDNKKRKSWKICPITRKPKKPNAYDRNKEKREVKENEFESE